MGDERVDWGDFGIGDPTLCDWCDRRIWWARRRAVLIFRYRYSQWYGRVLGSGEGDYVWMHPKCATEAVTEGSAAGNGE